MPLKPLSFREVKKRLEAFGFSVVSQKGSHVKFVATSGGIVLTAIVPKHDEIAIGTLRSILRQAQITVDQWNDLV